eukprot:1156551-Pleurochrysis_carterae.AAC.2
MPPWLRGSSGYDRGDCGDNNHGRTREHCREINKCSVHLIVFRRGHQFGVLCCLGGTAAWVLCRLPQPIELATLAAWSALAPRRIMCSRTSLQLKKLRT